MCIYEKTVCIYKLSFLLDKWLEAFISRCEDVSKDKIEDII